MSRAGARGARQPRGGPRIRDADVDRVASRRARHAKSARRRAPPTRRCRAHACLDAVDRDGVGAAMRGSADRAATGPWLAEPRRRRRSGGACDLDALRIACNRALMLGPRRVSRATTRCIRRARATRGIATASATTTARVLSGVAVPNDGWRGGVRRRASPLRRRRTRVDVCAGGPHARRVPVRRLRPRRAARDAPRLALTGWFRRRRSRRAGAAC